MTWLGNDSDTRRNVGVRRALVWAHEDLVGDRARMDKADRFATGERQILAHDTWQRGPGQVPPE